MRRSLVIAAALVVLAGCGEETKEPKTADEVIAEAGKLETPRPGKYETSVELIDFAVPGLPPKQAGQMKSMMGNASGQSTASCLTEEDAKKGFEEPIRRMTQSDNAMQCDFSRFDVDGGKIDAQLSCKGPQGMTSEMTIDGTGAAESTTLHMVMVQKAPMIPGGEMRMEMRMNSKRVGDCE